MLAVVLEHMRDRLQAGARDQCSSEMAQVTDVKSLDGEIVVGEWVPDCAGISRCGSKGHFRPHHGISSRCLL